MNPTKFSFTNQPRSFYVSSLDSINLMFSKPIRPNFSNEFFPILYSDFWGDYWGYFVFTRNALSTGRNQSAIGDYLARVNIVSSIVTLIFIFVLINSIKYLNKKNYFLIYILFSIFVTFGGYFWFLIKYPAMDSGDTIKSTYMIQGFHLIGILTINYLEKLKKRDLNKYIVVIVVFLVTFIHNFSAMLNHY